MTVPGRGPSLPQARDKTNEDPLDTTSALHDHYKLHAPQYLEAPIANQDHNTHHARSLLQRHNHNTNTNTNSNPKKRRSTDPNARLPYRRRQDSSAAGVSDDGIVTAIVQTVNIVQVIDSAGATVDVRTQYSDSNTVLIDSSTGTTILDPIAHQSANVEVSSASAPQAETTVEGTISATTSGVKSPATETSETATAISILAESSQGGTSATDTLTSAFPLTTAEAPFPVFSASNSSITLGAATQNSTTQISLLSINSTSSSTTSSSTDSSSSSSSISSSSSTSKDKSKSTTQTTTLDSTSTVDFAAGAGFGDSGATATAGNGDTNSAISTSSSDDAVDTKKVVGGVFGGIAAVALLLVIALLILRRKRNGGSGKGLNLLGGVGPKDNRSTVNRGLLEPGPSPPTSQTDSQTNRMTQRSSLPFFISSSLAALSGSKRDSTAASGAPEQGFVRLSGRKLPSVLTHGGDGFSDPRESVFSGTDSTFYRDSSGFYGGPGGLSAPNQRLALGSPMRPESGIIVMRSGPGKTPVREDNPFADPEPNPFTDSGHGLSPPRPPLGRSLTGSASGHSRGSGSRFTEEM